MIGNGAIILTVPDAPTNLAEDYSLRAVRQLSVTWSQGYAGGTPVIDYTISFSENMGSIQVLAETGSQLLTLVQAATREALTTFGYNHETPLEFLNTQQPFNWFAHSSQRYPILHRRQ